MTRDLMRSLDLTSLSAGKFDHLQLYAVCKSIDSRYIASNIST